MRIFRKLPASRSSGKLNLVSEMFPAKLVAGSTYTLPAVITNTGQGIIDPKDGYTLEITSSDKNLVTGVDPVPVVEPENTGNLSVKITTPATLGPLKITLALVHNSDSFVLQQREIDIIPPPSVAVHAQLGWRTISSAANVRILVYDKDTLLQKFSGLTMQNGEVKANRLSNIVPGTRTASLFWLPATCRGRSLLIFQEQIP